MDKDWPYANIDVQFLTVAAGSKYADWLSDPKSQEFFTDGYVALQADFWRIFLLSEYGGVYADMDMILLDDASLAGPDGLLYGPSYANEIQLSGAFLKSSKDNPFKSFYRFPGSI